MPLRCCRCGGTLESITSTSRTRHRCLCADGLWRRQCPARCLRRLRRQPLARSSRRLGGAVSRACRMRLLSKLSWRSTAWRLASAAARLRRGARRHVRSTTLDAAQRCGAAVQPKPSQRAPPLPASWPLWRCASPAATEAECDRVGLRGSVAKIRQVSDRATAPPRQCGTGPCGTGLRAGLRSVFGTTASSPRAPAS